MAIQKKSQTQCFLENGGQLWKLPISDYSFSQNLNQEDIVINEMSTGVALNRSIGQENISLDPADWSLTTFAKPFKTTGSGDGRASLVSGNHHATDEALWSMLGSSQGAVLQPGTALSDLDTYRGKVTWTTADISTAHGGSNANTIGYWAHAEPNVFDLYVLEKFEPNIEANYQDTFIWTCTTAGGLKIPVERGVNRSNQLERNGNEMRAYSDVAHGGGPVLFVYSYVHANQGSSEFFTTLLIPSDTTFHDFLNTNGALTITGTPKSTVYLSGVKDAVASSKWSFDFSQSQKEQLATGNLYFVTDIPQVTTVAGTVNSSNQLILEATHHHTDIEWNFFGSDSYASFFKGGYVPYVHIDHLQYQNTTSVTGWSLPTTWFVSGKGTPAARTGSVETKNCVYPSKIIRDGVEYPVTVFGTDSIGDSSISAIWNDGSNYWHCPTFRFRVQTDGKVNTIQIRDSKAPNVLAVSVASWGQRAGGIAGDIFVIPAGTLDDNGVALPVEVRFVATSASSMDLGRLPTSADRDVFIYGTENYKSDLTKTPQFEVFGRGRPQWLVDNDFYVEVEKVDSGTTFSLTENSNSRQDLRQITTATTQTDCNDSRNITLSASNSNIRLGALVTGSFTDKRVYVSFISGTTLRVQGNVTIPAGTTLTFIDYPVKAGLSQGEYRWYNSDGRNHLIYREPADFTGHNPDLIRVYTSRNKNTGGSAVMKLEDCVIDTASLNFGIDSMTQITWTGYAKKIHQEAPNFIIASSAPSSPSAKDIFYDIDDDKVQIRNAANTAWINCITEGVDKEDNFIINKLGTLKLANNVGTAQVNTILLDELIFSDPNAYSYLGGSSKYYSGLAGTNGMTANIAATIINLGDINARENNTQASYAETANWLGDYDWSLNIDGQTYGSSHFKGVDTWTVNSTLITAMRSETTFGDFLLAKNVGVWHNNANILLMFCTGTNASYNTAAKLAAANITLTGTAKSSVKTFEEFSIPITGGTVTILNNIQTITRNEIGKVNTMDSHVTGARIIKGEVSAYLDDTTSIVRNRIFEEMNESIAYSAYGEGDTEMGFSNPYTYNVEMSLGGTYLADNTVNLKMPTTSFKLPTIDSEEVFTTNIQFTALDPGVYQRDIISLNEAFPLFNNFVPTPYAGNTGTHNQQGKELNVIYKGK